MEELRSLTETAGGEVVGETVQRRAAPNQTTFMGKGKILELAEDARRRGATLLIMDNDLTPAQARNIERMTGLPLIDRSQLIMDIFAAGARTLQSRKQVELAQLEYTLPRLMQMWSHLSRIRSGIGMRGPGETQLEVDRRIIRQKISELKRSLKKIAGRKKREVASRDEFFKICLVGYTNSGKSTLLNRLTGARVKVEDRLFSTLDTRTRKWKLLNNQTALLSDTVGFIRKLPHHLVASFHATLEEAATADLLLHVVDCSRPSAERNIEAVNEVLAEIGVAATPQILVFNKTDRVDDFMEVNLLGRHAPAHILTSAVSGKGLDDLAERVERAILETYVLLEVGVPISSGRLRAFISDRGDIIESASEDGFDNIRLRLPRSDLGRLREIAAAEKGRVNDFSRDGGDEPEF
jgi:GTP-binding protein HflX